MPDSADTFPCLACNRRYRWNPAIAGKNLRCKCGQQISVPHVPGVAPPAVDYSPASDESENSIAHLLCHPIRNFVIPAIYAALILYCLIAFVPHLLGSTAEVAGFYIVTIGAALLVAGGIFIYNAARFEISPISFLLGSLKILTVILLADAALIALCEYGVDAGAITRHMYLTIFVLFILIFIFFAVPAAVVWGASFAIFHYHEDDFVALGFPLAAGGWVAHFLLVIAYLICANIYLKHIYRPPSPTSSPPAAIQTNTP